MMKYIYRMIVFFVRKDIYIYTYTCAKKNVSRV